mgnify:CR=1 FL=1
MTSFIFSRQATWPAAQVSRAAMPALLASGLNTEAPASMRSSRQTHSFRWQGCPLSYLVQSLQRTSSAL